MLTFSPKKKVPIITTTIITPEVITGEAMLIGTFFKII